MGDLPLDEVITPTSTPELFVIPSSIDLAAVEIELVARYSRERLLANAVALMEEKFDSVFLDCPPSLGLITVNALTAADEILIPIQAEYYALEGLTQLLRSIQAIQTNLNPQLKIEGAVITMYDRRTTLAGEVTAQVREHFGETAYETVIRAWSAWRKRRRLGSRSSPSIRRASVPRHTGRWPTNSGGDMAVRKAGLGRGLDALLAAGRPTGGFALIPVDAVDPNPRQPRDRFASDTMQSLANSIREVGVLQPIVVRPAGADGRHVLVAGERRLGQPGWPVLSRSPRSSGRATIRGASSRRSSRTCSARTSIRSRKPALIEPLWKILG